MLAGCHGRTQPDCDRSQLSHHRLDRGRRYFDALLPNISRQQRSLSVIFVNIQALLMVLYAAGVEGTFHGWMFSAHLDVACAMLIPALAISMLVFESRWLLSEPLFATGWTNALRVITVLTALNVASYGTTMLPWISIVLIGAALFALSEFLKGKRLQQEAYVWVAEYCRRVCYMVGLWELSNWESVQANLHW